MQSIKQSTDNVKLITVRATNFEKAESGAAGSPGVYLQMFCYFALVPNKLGVQKLLMLLARRLRLRPNGSTLNLHVSLADSDELFFPGASDPIHVEAFCGCFANSAGAGSDRPELTSASVVSTSHWEIDETVVWSASSHHNRIIPVDAVGCQWRPRAEIWRQLRKLARTAGRRIERCRRRLSCAPHE